VHFPASTTTVLLTAEERNKWTLVWKRWKKRVARWGKVKPCEQTFIESRLPGFEKRLYKIINRGVLENKGVEPAIDGSHRFAVTLIEVPVGQGAKLHSHNTEEVFFLSMETC
jgi:hypothetical protein